MANEHEKGHSIQDDFATLMSDTRHHDLTIVCADNIEIGTSRAILAARSDMLNTMLYGSMREASSDKINLPEIESDVMKVVLRFVYTEEINRSAISSMIKVYLAANFLLLHKLKKLILDRYIITCSDDDHLDGISFEPIPYSLAETVLDAPDIDDPTKSHIFDNLVLSSLRLGSMSKLLMNHPFHVSDKHVKWMEGADDTSARTILEKFLDEQQVDKDYGEWVAEQERNPGGPTAIKKRIMEGEPSSFSYPVKRGRFKRQKSL